MSAVLRCIDLVAARSALLTVHWRLPSRSHVNAGEGMKESENIHEPQNYRNHYDAIQNGLDGSLHWNKAIHQPQEDAHYDQNFQELN
jgi:hypothetical protein